MSRGAREKVYAKYGGQDQENVTKNLRYLLHRQRRTVFGGIAPLLVGVGMFCTTMFYFVPNEQRITERIKKVMDATLDEIDVLNEVKNGLESQLKEIQNKKKNELISVSDEL